ncbi:hypothetical protein TNCV_1401351 [Trichonephila clavipes]|nr:hypothetical protein TNCV_1401351 [Trichonephila clavipes]
MCGVIVKCRICDPCAARKGPRKRTRGRLQLYNVGAPFDPSPLPRSSDGNNNILVVMNYFTKRPEAHPTLDLSDSCRDSSSTLYLKI